MKLTRRFAPALLVLAIILFVLLSACDVPTAVEYQAVEFPGAVEPTGEPGYSDQWHYANADLPAAWGILESQQYGSRFGTTVVAVIDSGVVFDHEDLQDGLVCTTPGDCGYDYNEDVPGATDVESADWHGTHVAGIIAADSAFSGSGVGVVGSAAGRANVLPVKIFGDNVTSDDMVIEALRFASGVPDSDGRVTPTPARVFNLSFGFTPFNSCQFIDAGTALYESIQAAVDRGITVVAASGNCGIDQVLHPAGFDNVIAVGATDSNDVLTSYSNYGQALDFVAPGGANNGLSSSAIWSTFGLAYEDNKCFYDDGYAGCIGTSQATPHVAGIVALLYAYEPNLTQEQVYTILMETALDLGEPGWDRQYGHGLVQAGAALRYLIEAEEGLPVSPMGAGDGPSKGGDQSGAAAIRGTQPRGVEPPMSGAILPTADPDSYDGGSVIVRVTDAAAAGQGGADAVVSRLVADYDLSEAGGSGKIRALSLSAGQTPAEMIERLADDPDVQYAQPNFRYQLIR